MMKTSTRVSLILSFVIILGSMATCFFGVRHAVNQIPPEVRAGMTDTDWVGHEWIGRGFIVFLVGVAIGLIPLIGLLFKNLRKTR